MTSVSLTADDRRTVRRVGDVPKVEIRDPLATHRRLLLTYTTVTFTTSPPIW
jgi:hypothetical protein